MYKKTKYIAIMTMYSKYAMMGETHDDVEQKYLPWHDIYLHLAALSYGYSGMHGVHWKTNNEQQ